MRQHKTDDDDDRAETLAEMILSDDDPEWMHTDKIRKIPR